jgi:hypothetical protein
LRKLILRSKEKHKVLRKALAEEIEPSGEIEKMYLKDLVHLQSEIERWRRIKTAIENTDYREAMEKLLTRLMEDPDTEWFDANVAARDLASRWFTDQAAQKEVATLLKKFGLGQSAVEGEIVRSSLDTIVTLDGRLASLEERRTKAVRALAEYRSDLRPRLAASSSASGSGDGGKRKLKK